MQSERVLVLEPAPHALQHGGTSLEGFAGLLGLLSDLMVHVMRQQLQRRVDCHAQVVPDLRPPYRQLRDQLAGRALQLVRSRAQHCI